MASLWYVLGDLTAMYAEVKRQNESAPYDLYREGMSMGLQKAINSVQDAIRMRQVEQEGRDAYNNRPQV